MSIVQESVENKRAKILENAYLSFGQNSILHFGFEEFARLQKTEEFRAAQRKFVNMQLEKAGLEPLRPSVRKQKFRNY